jgi:hypothetical protein
MVRVLLSNAEGADGREVLLVMVMGESEQTRDIEAAVGRVCPRATPPGLVKRVDARDGGRSGLGISGQDRRERRPIETGRQARLGPLPLLVVLLRDLGEPRLPDDRLDGEQVKEVLGDAPLALRRVGGGGRPDGGRLELRREPGEVPDEFAPPRIGRGGTVVGGQSATRPVAPDPCCRLAGCGIDFEAARPGAWAFAPEPCCFGWS